MPELSREQADAVIEDLRVQLGAISAEERQFLVEHKQFGILEKVANLRQQVSVSTKVLVTELYSAETRFLYELIQNAEDNVYSIAKEKREAAFLAFRVYPDRIIIDSNEDGFSEGNVRAICAVGKSTKKNVDGYIGEKGIGFKSVFKIAKTVHIESGPFSFAFNYSPEDGDADLGMVTPENYEPEGLPTAVRTRMVLTLAEEVDFGVLESDFQTIPDTFLLFLRQLQILKVEVHPTSKPAYYAEYSKREKQEDGLSTTFLTKSTGLRASEVHEKKIFYTIKSVIRNLPHDDKRKNIDHAEVVLAFPIDNRGVPVIEQQQTYAFLPLRKVGFKFLIQSDFVTMANREDVKSSPRNKAILKGVASTFRDAMVLLCERSLLRYQWMRYLPGDTISDDFWKILVPLVVNLLKDTPLLESWSGVGLHCPSNLRRISTVCDRSGEPLLRDIKPELYLSNQYTDRDSQSLTCLGTTTIRRCEFIDRLDSDIRMPDSRWKSLDYNQSWRSQICTYLLSILKSDDLENVKRLKRLDLIPLHDGTWEHYASGGGIYFPDTKTVPIPTDVDLALVDNNVVQNNDWEKLLCRLGVDNIDPRDVIERIYERHRGSSEMTLTDGISHARYLYHFLPKNSAISELRKIMFLNSSRKQRYGRRLYFPDIQDEYSPAALFKDVKSIFRPCAEFLHNDYLTAVDTTIKAQNRSWAAWLEEAAGIMRTPRLVSQSGELSYEFKSLIRRKPDKVLGTLKRYWPQYKSEVPSVNEELQASEVRLKDGRMFRLGDVFLPLPRLESIASQLGLFDSIPFMPMSRPLRDEEHPEWAFLQNIIMGIDDDIYFYYTAVRDYKDTYGSRENFPLDGLIQLYLKIQSKYDDAPDFVRESFQTHALLYVPPTESRPGLWAKITECVWDGPPWLEWKWPLNVPAYEKLQSLIKVSLNVPDDCISDIISDLVSLKDSQDGLPTESAIRIYDYLPRRFSNQDDAVEICDAFEKSFLIYVPTENTWLPPSRCVWAEQHVKIPGKASIAGSYHSLESFFLSTLEISKPTARMLVESLKAEAKNRSSSSRLKDIMVLINGLGANAANVASLKNAEVFPIKLKNGKSSLVSSTYQFIIFDNDTHRENFEGKVDALEFSLEDIRDTRNFLLANQLQDRFSSRVIKEITNVDGGSPALQMTQTLRSKSETIVRCAIHFAEPGNKKDIKTLYTLFCHAAVYTSDSIGRSMQITQNRRTVEGLRSRANFHLEEQEGILKLYLPKDETEREVCFERQLPKRICEFLGVTDPAAEGVVGSILRKDNPKVIHRILNDAGVSILDFDFSKLASEFAENEDFPKAEKSSKVEEPTRAENAVDASRTPVPNEKYFSRSLEQETRRSSSTLVSNSSSPLVGASSTPFKANADLNADTTLFPSPSAQRFNVTNETAYAKVLKNVVDIARKRVECDIFETGHPRGGHPSLVATLADEVIREALDLRSRDRNFKLGAAGELYMFEYLSGLNLPGFSRRNWRSSIRDRVRSHDDYKDIENISDRSALADIEYDDAEGILTEFLVNKGHLDRELWANQRPYYHVEVKATPNPNWQEPFYMSKNQESHIQSKRITENTTAQNIYILCRIFNLGRGDQTGFFIYLDPETKRRNQQLEFTTFTWAVKPLWYHNMPGWDSRPRQSDTDEISAQAQPEPENNKPAPNRKSVPIVMEPGLETPFQNTSKKKSSFTESRPVSSTRNSNSPPRLYWRGKRVVVNLPSRNNQSEDSPARPRSAEPSIPARVPTSWGTTAFSFRPGVQLENSLSSSNISQAATPEPSTTTDPRLSESRVFRGTGLGGLFNSPSPAAGSLFGSSKTRSTNNLFGTTNSHATSSLFGSLIAEPKTTGLGWSHLESNTTGPGTSDLKPTTTLFGSTKPGPTPLSRSSEPGSNASLLSTADSPPARMYYFGAPKSMRGLGTSSPHREGRQFGSSNPESTTTFGTASSRAGGSPSGSPKPKPITNLFGTSSARAEGVSFEASTAGSTINLSIRSGPRTTAIPITTTNPSGVATSPRAESTLFGSWKFDPNTGLFGPEDSFVETESEDAEGEAETSPFANKKPRKS